MEALRDLTFHFIHSLQAINSNFATANTYKLGSHKCVHALLIPPQIQKLLFWRFIHCAMVFPLSFITSLLSSKSLIHRKVRNSQRRLSWLLLITPHGKTATCTCEHNYYCILIVFVFTCTSFTMNCFLHSAAWKATTIYIMYLCKHTMKVNKLEKLKVKNWVGIDHCFWHEII